MGFAAEQTLSGDTNKKGDVMEQGEERCPKDAGV